MLNQAVTPSESGSDCTDFYQSNLKRSQYTPHTDKNSQSDLNNLYGYEYFDYNTVPIPFNEPNFTNLHSSPEFNVPIQAMTTNYNQNNPLFSSWKTLSSTENLGNRNPQIDPKSGLPRKICSNCGSISTPSWRRCPEGRNLLCNACGLYQKLHNRPRPLKIHEDGSVQVIRNLNSTHFNVCQNCKTTDTPSWRRSHDERNLLLCNACALYLKNHNSLKPPNFNSNEE